MRQYQKGYLIIEALIAIVIFVTIVLTLFSSTSFVLVKTERTRYDSQASLLLQEGIEASYNVMLSNWSDYSAGTYYPAPELVSGGRYQWALVNGEEQGIQTRFDRKVEILRVCRSTDSGEIIEPTGSFCAGEIDENSKIIRTTINWEEAGKGKFAEFMADHLL